MFRPTQIEHECVLNLSYTISCLAWVCGHSLAGIAGSNPAGGMDVCREYCVLLGRGLCVGPIPRPGESYRVCVIECSQVQQ